MVIIQSKNLLSTYDDESKVKVLKDENGWRIYYNSEEFFFDQRLIRFRPDLAYLRYSEGKGFFLAWASETGESRTGISYTYMRGGMCPGVGGRSLLAAFWVGSDDEVSIYVPDPLAEDSDLKDSNIRNYEGVDKNPLHVFSNNIPEAALFVQRIRAKQKMMREINELDVLASMEAQLDWVTKIVLDAHPDEKLAAALAGCSVLELLDRDKLAKTIKNQKEHLRALQRTYFSERGSMINGKPSV